MELPPADDGDDLVLESNNWQKPSSDTLSEIDEEVEIVNIEPPPPRNHDSNSSESDNSEENVPVSLEGVRG